MRPTRARATRATASRREAAPAAHAASPDARSSSRSDRAGGGGEPEIRPVAHRRAGRPHARDSNIFIRGELDRPRPRRPARHVTLPGMPPLGADPVRPAAAGSSWPTGSPSRQNPLTARVMVNRVWQHLFGQGLVDDRRQLRHDRRAADAPRAARPPRRAVHERRLVGEAADPPGHAEQRRTSRPARSTRRSSRSTRTTGCSGGRARGGWRPRRSATRCSPPPARSTATGRSGRR